MLLENFTDCLGTFINSLFGLKNKQPYWVEIKTREPYCIYYFGPFGSYAEAKNRQSGYIEDLIAEKAVGIKVQIKRSSPTELTITSEEELVQQF